MHQTHYSEEYHPVPSFLYRKKHDGKLLKYDVLQEIGKGGFGIVYSAIESPSRKMVALKCTPKWRLNKPKIKQKLINEMTIHRSLDHPNIVKFLGTFHDEYYIYFILELCEGGNVLEYIKNFNSNRNGNSIQSFYRSPSNRVQYSFNDRTNLQYLPEFEVIKITIQMLKALDYLHSKANVIHRDIKLQNFLMTKNGIVKLSDFGLSIKYEDVSDIISICGTPNYISPEVIDRDSHTSAVDIWAVGVIVFLMLTGQRPFKSDNNKKTFERIRQVHYDWPTWPSVSEQAKSFVDSILKKDPLDRPTARILLSHPFLCLNNNKTNKKSNSSDPNIKFSVPNGNSARISTSSSVYTSNSNNASTRSSSIQSTKSLSTQNYQSNIQHSPPKTLNRSFSPSHSPIYSKNMQDIHASTNRNPHNTSPNSQNRSIPHEKNNLQNNLPPSPSNVLTSKRIQNCSLSPVRSINHTLNIKTDMIPTSHLTNYSSHNFINTQSSYQFHSPSSRLNSRIISHIIIPEDRFSDLNEEIKQKDSIKNQKQQKNVTERYDDVKLDRSSSIILKATIETIEDAAKQAEKAVKSQKLKNDSPLKSQNNNLSQKEQQKENKNKKTLDATSLIQLTQNKDDSNPEYHIDFGIIPSSHSNAFPQSSVLLWWDYASRYGLGYIMYNGCVGVCFNDLSRIIMEPTEKYAQFYSRPHSKMEIVKLEDYETESNQPEENNNINENSERNKNLISGQKSIESDDTSLTLPNKKKILILKHFAKNLKKMALKYIDSNLFNVKDDSNLLYEKMASKQLDYIKYWGTNKKDGILFRMNGKSLQASFTDKTSLYIYGDSKKVIYDDSKQIYKVSLHDLAVNKKMNSIQSKFLIAKELGKNLE